MNMGKALSNYFKNKIEIVLGDCYPLSDCIDIARKQRLLISFLQITSIRAYFQLCIYVHTRPKYFLNKA